VSWDWRDVQFPWSSGSSQTIHTKCGRALFVIGVDELSFRRHHEYVTVVVDP
jgi:hypothetical protein